ncbi:MAG: alpha/beta hydrolase [Pseudomonadota bacterium]
MTDSKSQIVEIKADGISISCLLRENDDETIVLIHGLGCCKENFLGAFDCERLKPYSLLAPDLPGFGDSDKPGDYSYSMQDQARLVAQVIDRCCGGTFHLVAHSMGGIVGIELAGLLPVRISSFINVEGNLTDRDCTLSRTIAAMTEEEFIDGGFALFRQGLAMAVHGADNMAGEAYLKMLEKADARAMYRSSVSTVRESDSGALLGRLTGLACATWYIYGEKNMGMFPAEKQLLEKGVPVKYIPESGHSPMDENPDAFYDLVFQLLQ